MDDNETLKRYENVEDSDKMEVTLNFVDVIALKISYQETYKMITFTKEISTVVHLKKQLKLKDFIDPPKELTEENIAEKTQLFFNDDLIQLTDFTKLIKRGQITQWTTIHVEVRKAVVKKMEYLV